MIADRDDEPDRQAHDDDDHADGEVEGALDEPVRAGEHRRAQLEQRRSLAGYVLAALDQELRRLGRQPHFHACTVRRLDDLEHRLLVEVALGEDQLVRPRLREDRDEPVERAELPEPRRRLVADRAREVVGDAAARGDKGPVQAGDVVPSADENGAPADTEDAPQLDDDRVVGRAQQADRQRAHGTRGRQQAVGRELVPVAECERDRDGRDEHE